jgi:hypothetical protein
VGIGTGKDQTKVLSNIDHIDVSKDGQAPVEYPSVPQSKAFQAVIDLTDSCEIPMNSPFPRVHHWLALTLSPKLIAAGRVKEQFSKNMLDQSWKRLNKEEKHDNAVKCALDLILSREMTMAKNEGRPAQYDTRAIRDELFGFIMAGHETTSTTACWGLKL